jgi:FAD/FMN-containing dehydrogenase
MNCPLAVSSASTERASVIDRRQFLKLTSAAVIAARCGSLPPPSRSLLVNDVHSRLNPTLVADLIRPGGIDELRRVVHRSRREGRPLSISGSRHAMGGQQFARDALLLDMRSMNRVLGFDRETGLLTVEPGIDWVELMESLRSVQQDGTSSWGIRQKQTGADRLTIGGALAANVHGRGLTMKPFIEDVEAFELLDADGRVRNCSRRENAELFGLAIGGYGLFGILSSVTLRLVPRRKVERVVEILPLRDLMASFEQQIREGYLYGDFQFSTDDRADQFLSEGVFSCYRPVADDTPIDEGQRRLAEEDWRRLTLLAHVDKAEAYRQYAAYYLATSGQIYWSDTHQMSVYLDDYHTWLDQVTGSPPGTEMITEIYVPRTRLADFMAEVREDFTQHAINLIYGTVRLIEKDVESFLAWAREPWACVIFNLHVPHDAEGRARTVDAFRRLIDYGASRGGSYYLTYHRWASREQLLRCYPQFPELLEKKLALDPEERFQSDWYRHYREMFAAG